jgi:hypothetical protein
MSYTIENNIENKIQDKIQIAKCFTKELERKHIYLEDHLVFDSTDDLAEYVNNPTIAMDFTPNSFNGFLKFC